MLKKVYNFRLIGHCLVFVLLTVLSGCMEKEQAVPRFSGIPIEADRIVYLGFKPALNPGQAPVLFQNPMTGVLVRSEPVSQSSADLISDKLYSFLVESRDYDFINLREIKNLTDTSLYEESSDGGIKMIQSIGKAVSADVALTGYVYRMRERQGNEYSVEGPASVAFDLYLINVKDGSFLWKGSFDKTQKTLSENLLDFKSFLKFKGKWVDAGTLAEIGLKEILGKIPLKVK